MTDPHGPPPHAGVVIGLKEIYDQLVILATKVEVMLGSQIDADKLIADHETRLRALERGRWPLPTLGVLLALASVVVAVIALTR